MRLIILGPPGAGKGTQASRIADKLGIPAISTGDIFRANIKDETELGLQVKEILASGGYVSDEVTNAIVADRLAREDCEPGFLLDGYPRTLAQVGALDAMLAARGVALGNTEEMLNRLPTTVDPATLPPVTVDEEVRDYDHELAGGDMTGVLVALARNLELENQALLQRDEAILEVVAHGDRLEEMRGRLRAAEASGVTVLTHYNFDEIHVALVVPFGEQTGLSLGLTGRGTMTEETRDADGNVMERQSSPFHQTFAMRRALGDRWMNVGVLPVDE